MMLTFLAAIDGCKLIASHDSFIMVFVSFGFLVDESFGQHMSIYAYIHICFS